MSETATKPIINGIEVKVGQVWEDDLGNVETVIGVTAGPFYPITTNKNCYTVTGRYYGDFEKSRFDLVRLIKDVESSLDSTFQQLNKEFDNLNTALDSVFNACKNSANNQDKKHLHYFKDVSHLDTIDIYRVLQLYKVTDPCQQHAAKKVLLAGGRGGKDYLKDIQEAIDTLERLKVMLKEDERNSSETKE